MVSLKPIATSEWAPPSTLPSNSGHFAKTERSFAVFVEIVGEDHSNYMKLEKK
jgi:hypothetical protein